MELNNEIRRKKDLSALAVLKSFFVCEKWSVIFVISKFFLPTKRSAIADDRPLFATLDYVRNYARSTKLKLFLMVYVRTYDC